ncbi:DUF2497 domain-containing protein [Sphingomicrobium astaxanthinifaciens]|uniref:DUF2497 domain-containing protein n=1 Tax=Sphingomicrobium astaxanthinifaciens TaxID=1227949 RepID=UPI001FCC2E35|nr:DUF2497 domain-containing protein [Sphingomicrobium astaxanthinifaciens]MCJ7420661.1 DUF2497 domain-containing protein [Sphingomicrobium astaxanthinifaciens]
MEDILASIKKVIAEEDAPREPQERRAKRAVTLAAEPEEEDDVLDLSNAEAPAGAGHDPAAPPAEAANLMAEDAAGSTRSRLEELANVAANAPPGANVNPLEEVVRDMLRPMLKQWLDERLPGIVDEHVRREISRITGRKL